MGRFKMGSGWVVLLFGQARKKSIVLPPGPPRIRPQVGGGIEGVEVGGVKSGLGWVLGGYWVVG